MKKDKKFIVLEIILLIFIIMYKIALDNLPYLYSDIFYICFWLLIGILLFIYGGFPKDNCFYKRNVIKIIIIGFLLFILISYCLGLFLGFVKNLYFYNFLMFLEKVLALPSMIIFLEISRYLFFKRNPGKLHIYIFTLLIIILNVIMEISNYNIIDFGHFLILLSSIIIPIILREVLVSYIIYNVGLLPAIIYKILFLLYGYFVPFLPDLGDYLVSIFGLLIPYLFYYEINKCIRYREKYGLHAKKTLSRFLSCFLILFLLVIISLTSGIFKYQLIAIASGSMEPVYYRGDAVIIEKISADKIKINDILVYKVNSGIITHRVVDINDVNGVRYFITKGDNNSAIDTFNISEDDVKGRVKFIVKYLGYPTVIFNEFLESM